MNDRYFHPLACPLQNGLPAFTKKLWPSRFFLHSSVFSVFRCMGFTKYFSSFSIETFALHIFLAERAVEALWVVVVVECLHPPVTRLYGEPAGDALGREQLIPIFFAVRQAVLQVEGEVGEGLAAVGAAETLGVEVGAEGLQTVLLFYF